MANWTAIGDGDGAIKLREPAWLPCSISAFRHAVMALTAARLFVPQGGVVVVVVVGGTGDCS